MNQLRLFYHFLWAFSSALFYRFPSRKVKVIAVTGTKGKSSTTEIINAIFEEAGYKTALSNTIRFKIGDQSEDNMYKMSMPGRFFIQRFIRRAVDAKCDFLIMEMTSQGSAQFRHKFIPIRAFVVTNISPEHIESHGSYEKYIQAKINIGKNIRNGVMILNADDKEAERFLQALDAREETYSLAYANPQIKNDGTDFTLWGKRVHTPLPGIFNLYNIHAAIATAREFDIPGNTIIRAIEKFSGIRGRVEKVELGQNFTVVIDYAHTPDSLTKLYQHFKSQRIIAVFGCTGGGRDHWKRKEMGKIADEYASEIILTDDDSYDENPKKICEDIVQGISKNTPTILTDRREAIREAFRRARPGDAVLITGKGTDPYLMGPQGAKIPWSDRKVAEEELRSLVPNTSR